MQPLVAAETVRIGERTIECSSSGLMHTVFGDDIYIIQPAYDEIITELCECHPDFANVLEVARGRTGFLLPYLTTEYGYSLGVQRFIPADLRELVIGYSLIGLGIAISDDVVDGIADRLHRMSLQCTGELLRHKGYSLLLENSNLQDRNIVLDSLSATLRAVAEFQYKDAIFKSKVLETGFLLERYLFATFKTGSVIDNGLVLGLRLAGAEKGQEALAKHFGRLCGCILQILDDILDIDEDASAYGQVPVTYPLSVLLEDKSFECVFEHIGKLEAQAEDLALRFRNPDKALSMLAGLQQAANHVEARTSVTLR